jgi:hypothetical protein
MKKCQKHQKNIDRFMIGTLQVDIVLRLYMEMQQNQMLEERTVGYLS